MQIKTSELTGTALDWAVAKCEGREPSHYKGVVRATAHPDCPNSPPIFGPVLNYSSDWSQGGPIIDREDIQVGPNMVAETTESKQEIYRKHGCTARSKTTAYWKTPIRTYGETPLIAAMRCYVASKLGDTVEVPDELTEVTL